MSSLGGLACTQKAKPSKGEMLLLLSSDLPVPESIDSLIVTVDIEDKHWSYAYGTQAAATAANTSTATNAISDAACQVNGKMASGLALPTTIALYSDREEPTPMTLSIAACKGGELVFHRQGIQTALPAPGELTMLRAPIRWLCGDRSQDCFGCYEQRCYHRDIFLQDNAVNCEVAECNTDTAELFTAVAYNETLADAYDPQATPASGCFDPSACFDMTATSQLASSPSFPLAADWEPEPATSDARCVAPLDPRVDRNWLNLALVLPPGEQGFCNSVRCLVPMDAEANVGWTFDAANSQIVLPHAVCTLLDAGRILYVVGSTRCQSKTSPTPTCGRRESAATTVAPTGGEPSTALIPPAIRWTLDRSDTPPSNLSLWDSASGIDLTPRPTSSLNMSSALAVKGQAGQFDNTQYAVRDLNWPPPIPTLRTYTAWVSLTQSGSNDSSDAVMPILSNVSESCKAGVRLELRTCNHRDNVVFALGRPNGKNADGTCRMDYAYAALASRSYAGGYFTPWQGGNWYHLAATIDGTTALYIDGVSVAADSTCSFPDSAPKLSDGSSFYLGSSQEAIQDSTTKTPTLLLDEVQLFDQALTEQQVKTLYIESANTVFGATGLRWGTWGMQGGWGQAASVATMDAGPPIPSFHVDDNAWGNAGVYAFLRQDPTSRQELALPLSEFDEAVLVAELPAGEPFQFALSADHGLRQCTWQLVGNKSMNASTTPSKTYIINLRHPSWCVGPECLVRVDSFDRVTVGSDWSKAQTDQQSVTTFAYKISAVAFRKRLNAANPSSPNTRLGGVPGPSNWCWKTVAFDAGWDLEPSAQVATASNPPSVSMKMPSALTASDPPLLAADLPDQKGVRDLTVCESMRVRLSQLLHSNLLPNASVPVLAFQNDRGQSCTLHLNECQNTADGTCVTTLSLLNRGCEDAWPSVRAPATLDEVLEGVVRLELRYPGQMTVESIECCTSGVCSNLP